MPGPKTHDIFYHQLKKKLNTNTLSSFKNYDDYSVFAQGHDFFIYYNFYKIWNQKKLDQNVQESVLLQEHKFQEFVYNYLKSASNSGAIEDEQTRLFIGPGYVMHHILDAYTHPYIIYYAGDHTRDPKNKTWQHGIVENLLDIYMMNKYEFIDPKTYPVHLEFEQKRKISPSLVDTLNESLEETYGIANGGNKIEIAIWQMPLFMKTLKFDKHGIKKVLFDSLDSLLKGTSSFSYHRDIEEVSPYLNEKHEVWLHPMYESIQSTESFMDLYNKALENGSQMVDSLEALCQSGRVHRDDIYSIIPNIASTYGLECGQEFKIKNKKYFKK